LVTWNSLLIIHGWYDVILMAISSVYKNINID